MASSLYTLIFAATLAIVAEAKPSLECDIIWPVEPSSNSCGDVITYGLNDYQKNQILYAHMLNNIGRLKWSDDLAEAAQRWAGRCEERIDPCLHSHAGSLKQMFVKYHDNNIDTDLNAMITLQLAVENARESGVSFPFALPCKSLWPWRNSIFCPHYTMRVGCGLVVAKQQSGINKHLLVCNYGRPKDAIEQPANDGSGVKSSCSSMPVKKSLFSVNVVSKWLGSFEADFGLTC